MSDDRQYIQELEDRLARFTWAFRTAYKEVTGKNWDEKEDPNFYASLADIEQKMKLMDDAYSHALGYGWYPSKDVDM